LSREARYSHDAGFLLVREMVETGMIIVGAGGARVITFWQKLYIGY